MNFLDVPAVSQMQRQNWFFEPCIFILRVARFLSPLVFEFKFCLSHVTVSAPAFLAIHFQWNFLVERGVRGVFYTFSSFLSLVGHRKGWMGRLPSCALVFIRYWWKKLDRSNPLQIFPVQSFLLFSCLSCFKLPSLLSRDFPSTFFLFKFFFLLASCFLFLHFKPF